MSSKVLTPKRFLVYLLVLLGLFCSPLLLSYRYLDQYHETLSPKQVVDRLEADPQSFYRSYMHDDLRETALEMIRRRQPEVIALGSSLPLYFREEFFSATFSCACGVMDSLSDGEVFVKRLNEVARPKVVLFVLDFWWFTDPEERFRPEMAPLNESPRLSYDKLRQPYKQIMRGQINWAQFLGFKPVPEAGFVKNTPIGLMARLDNVGRRYDGSELNGLVFSERAWKFYEPVRSYLANADEVVMRRGRFGPDMTILPQRIERLNRIVQSLEEHGAYVILVYPPMAPAITTAMEASGHHEYFLQLGKQIAGMKQESYDFHSAAALGIPASEFSDTHHAGNTAYMRLLLRMLSEHPGSPLRPRVNLQKLPQWIEAYRGTTVTVFEKDRITTPETDFLGVGVSKDHVPNVFQRDEGKRE